MAGRESAAPIKPGALMAGSKAVIGFWLVHASTRRNMAPMVLEPLRELMEMTASGSLVPLPGSVYPLAEGRRAHEDIRARRTTGKVVLTP